MGGHPAQRNGHLQPSAARVAMPYRGVSVATFLSTSRPGRDQAHVRGVVVSDNPGAMERSRVNRQSGAGVAAEEMHDAAEASPDEERTGATIVLRAAPYRPAGGPAGCLSHTGGCSALHAMAAMRQTLPLFTSVKTSAPQWDQAPLT